jgi:hypothetical protein
MLTACPEGAQRGDELRVVATDPVAGDVAADPMLRIRITFDEALDAERLDEEAFAVKAAGDDVSGGYEVQDDGTTWTFVADAPVGRWAEVRVHLGGNIAGRSGRVLGEPQSFSFRTRSAGLAVEPHSFVGFPGDSEGLVAWVAGTTRDGRPTFEPAPDVVWSSDDEAVAEVDGDGTLRLLGRGRSTVRAQSLGWSAPAAVGAADRSGAGTGVLSTSAQVVLDTPSGQELALHTWDLYEDGGLLDGGSGQFDGVWRLVLNPDTAPESFPAVAVPAVSYDAPFELVESLVHERPGSWTGHAREGTGSCRLLPLGEAAMHRELQLPSTAPVTVDWWHQVRTEDPFLAPMFFRVTLDELPSTGSPIEIFRLDGDGDLWSWWSSRSIDITPWAGRSVRLAFEVQGGGYGDRAFGAFVDDLRVMGGDGVEALGDGDCEAGVGGWVGEWVRVPREVNLTPQSIGGVEVSRSIYAPYHDGHWLRYLDAVHNPSTEAQTVTVRLVGDLGSNGNGAVYSAHQERAWISHDLRPTGGAASVGLLPGMADTLSLPDRDGDWTVEYVLELEAGATRHLLAYHLLGTDNQPRPSQFLEDLSAAMLESLEALAWRSPYATGISAEAWDNLANW